MASCPTYLWCHHDRIPGVYTDFPLAYPTAEERAELTRKYGREPLQFSGSNETLLELAIRLRENASLGEFIKKNWDCLNEFESFANVLTLSQLNPSVLAYLVVCFFHRLDERCPRQILEHALDAMGVAGGRAVQALRKMEYFDGYGMFRFSKENDWPRRGDFVTARLPYIAQQAWDCCPVGWLKRDVAQLIVNISVDVPEKGVDVARTAVQLSKRDGDDEWFPIALTETWHEAAMSRRVEMQYVAHVCSVLQVGSLWNVARRLYPSFEARLKPTPDGWLAALQCWYLSHEDERERAFPEHLDLVGLIECADFSIAPSAARLFAQRIESIPSAKKSFCERLTESLDGKTEWKLDYILLNLLLSNEKLTRLVKRHTQVQSWLEDHPSDSYVREKYLELLSPPSLSPELDELRCEIAAEMAKWLREPSNWHDKNVRTKLLTFLKENATTPRSEQQTKKAYKKRRPASRDDALREKLAELIHPTAEMTLRWLGDRADDTVVRVQFLSFLARLPLQFSARFESAAEQTSSYLKGHPNDFHVRQEYLNFLSVERPDDLPRAIEETMNWFKEDRFSANLAAKAVQSVSSVNDPDLVVRILAWASELVTSRGYLGKDKVIVVAVPGAYQSALSMNCGSECESALETLRDLKSVYLRWYAENPCAGKPRPI